MLLTELSVLALLLAANSAPILFRQVFGERWMRPLDGGWTFIDGQPLFGHSKTLAGLLAALLTSTLLASLLGLGWRIGLLIGCFAMIGDLFSSFVKRRLRLHPGSRALALDQVPESLFPLVVCAPLLEFSWIQVLLLTLAFLVLDLLLSRIAFKLGIRRRPY